MEPFTEKTWGDAEINQALAQMPSLIASKSVEVVMAERHAKEMKHLVTMTEAMVKSQRSGEKLTATELNAIAYQETGELRSQMFDAESDWQLKKAQLDYLRDTFDSARKAANIRIEEMRSLHGSVRDPRTESSFYRNNNQHKPL